MKGDIPITYVPILLGGGFFVGCWLVRKGVEKRRLPGWHMMEKCLFGALTGFSIALYFDQVKLGGTIIIVSWFVGLLGFIRMAKPSAYAKREVR